MVSSLGADQPSGAHAGVPLDTLADSHPDALTIAGLYNQVERTLARAFPRNRHLWIRGEIQHVADQHERTGHCYLDLVDPDSAGDRQAPVLRVKCWRSTWGPLRAVLIQEGIELAPGMVVVLRGTLDFYKPKAEVGFIMAELDVTSLLGRLAAQRSALLRTLAKEGLLERNRELAVPEVALRVGLVASPGTEGYRDFLGQLTSSGFAFQVIVRPVRVQGSEAPGAVARAIRSLTSAGPDHLDVVVVVRGGGSKADLAPFDSEPVARAIATSAVPVWTGIGHTGDESVADAVANRSCITPTECGRELATRLSQWWETRVADPGARVTRRAADALAAQESRHHDVRRRMAANARHLVHRQGDLIVDRARTLVRRVPETLAQAHDATLRRSARLGPLAASHLDRSEDRLEGWRRLLAAYDVERQLERGYTLTLDAEGRIVRSAAATTPGDVLSTRFADGAVRSVVETVGTGQERDREERQ